jgi:hypothetical protein
MATNLPPASNELLDGDAMEWLADNGYIFKQSPSVDLSTVYGARRVWWAAAMMSLVWGTDPDGIPKNGGGYYSPFELVDRQDLEAWAASSAIIVPETQDVPGNFAVVDPNINYPYTGNELQWRNDPDSTTDWRVEIWIDDTTNGTGTPDVVINCAPTQDPQAWAHQTTGNHDYKIRYRHYLYTNRVSGFTTEINRTGT